MKIEERYGEVGMQKCQVIFDRALKPFLYNGEGRREGVIYGWGW
jgi:hypothetical protein